MGSQIRGLPEQCRQAWDKASLLKLPGDYSQVDKVVILGLGGSATINSSHFLGAVSDLESIMGRIYTPVRDVVDSAFDRFLSRLR